MMKVKTAVRIFFVFCVVPYFQRVITIVSNGLADLSQKLDNWAYSIARRLPENKPLNGENRQVDPEKSLCEPKIF